jgi:uncharacterized coiled-coil protein SlyX
MLFEATDPSLIGPFLEQYGPLGIGFGVLLTIMLRQNKAAQKRIENLESQQKEQYEKQIADQKQMITEYNEMVRNKIKVLSDLTNCIKAIKDTLDRMERNLPK